ncbi:MAG TPA: YHS domain-containing protein [Limnochordales bacterium]
MARDPVCGAEVDESRTPLRAVFQGAAYYFCSGRCKAEFDRDPQRYVGDREAEARPDGAGGAWRC